jgi:hypothetical protein
MESLPASRLTIAYLMAYLLAFLGFLPTGNLRVSVGFFVDFFFILPYCPVVASWPETAENKPFLSASYPQRETLYRGVSKRS